jgi:hypothetical protein
MPKALAAKAVAAAIRKAKAKPKIRKAKVPAALTRMQKRPAAATRTLKLPVVVTKGS